MTRRGEGLGTPERAERPGTTERAERLGTTRPAVRCEIFLTWAAAERANRVVLEGESGAIVIDGCAIEVRETGTPASREELPPSLAEGSHHPDWFRGVIEEFLGEIREPARRGASVAQARRCLHWIRSAYESSRRAGKSLPVFPVSSAAAAGALP